ncbi:hypothetical protein HHK36_014880 [Tetracentron sinense]|uniref:Uncharacterized protein n=1 Tax=Tetracentron sinense TaxID=13715 RepID=A0A835DD43_TETSI|nr:hypothetical protein HHK36_014880 [Tetracentron sinense]
MSLISSKASFIFLIFCSRPYLRQKTPRHPFPITKSLPRRPRVGPIRPALPCRLPPSSLHSRRLRRRRRPNSHLRPRPSSQCLIRLCHHRFRQSPSPCRYPRRGTPPSLRCPSRLRPLFSQTRLFLAPLTNDLTSDCQIANAVAVDYKGNAFVTNSAGNFIWKVNSNGQPSIFSRSPMFTSQYVDPNLPYSFCGLNGIAYISKGYLLVVQSNTGKMFKVDADDGTASMVLLTKDLMGADGIAVRSDGVAVVVSQQTAWFLKSDDSWGEAVVYDETTLDAEKFPTSVAIREDDRAYVVYGHVDEVLGVNWEERSLA